tara:strand:+ start:721 stop:1137 length:417 start_codon:yes stop_codon:yes gene_type:complete
MASKVISIQATIEADINKVWEYWNLPSHIINWNFASNEWHCPKASNDLRVGGKLSSRMEAKDGSFGFDFGATYTAVIPHKKISYKMDDGRNATIKFEDLGKHTKILIDFEAETENPIEMQRDGWQAILNNFKDYVEKN